MRNVTISTLVLIAGLVAITQSGHASPEAPTAEDLLAAYARKVHSEILPKADEMDSATAMAAISSIAADILVPHKEMLMAKAKGLLADLPKLKLGDRSGWEVIQKDDGSIKEGIHQELSGRWATSQPDGQILDQEAMLLVACWNPVSAARSARLQLMVGRLGPKDYGARVLIEQLAPPIVSTVSSDAQNPVIAFETGRDVVLVYLKLGDAGYYLPEKAEWLRKKAQP